MMFKLIIVSFIAIIVVLFVRLSYLKYIKQDLEQELDIKKVLKLIIYHHLLRVEED